MGWHFGEFFNNAYFCYHKGLAGYGGFFIMLLPANASLVKFAMLLVGRCSHFFADKCRQPILLTEKWYGTDASVVKEVDLILNVYHINSSA